MADPIDPIEPPCSCPAPGWCERFQMEQQEFFWKRCRGEICSAERASQWRAEWRKRRQKQSKPGIVQKAMNFVGSMLTVAKAKATEPAKPILASEATVESRLAICAANTCGFYDPEKTTCEHPSCGCPMRRILKRGAAVAPGKAQLAAMKCPVGLWGPEAKPAPADRAPPDSLPSSSP